MVNINVKLIMLMKNCNETDVSQWRWHKAIALSSVLRNKEAGAQSTTASVRTVLITVQFVNFHSD
jgi:hypothetical protein